MTLLDIDEIRAPMTARPRARLDSLEVFAEIESTNSYLLSEPPPPAGRFRVALAEHQTAGRGRMDRRWHSPASSGLCMSMAYTFAHARADMSAVTLAAGVGVARVLEQIGVSDLGLKWPNDLICRGGKLGGILTEVRRRSETGATVVIGIGINVDLGATMQTSEMNPSVGTISDLASCGIDLPTRSALSARLIEQLFDVLNEFEINGLHAFADDYARLDWLQGKRVSVESGDGETEGVADGVDTDGALRIKTGDGVVRIRAGSVRLLAGDP